MLKKLLFINFMLILTVPAYAAQETPHNEPSRSSHMEDRINSIEQSLAMLQKYIYNLDAKKSKQHDAPSSLDLTYDIEDISDQVKEIRGETEKLRHEYQSLETRVNKALERIENEFKELKQSEKALKSGSEVSIILNNIEDRLDDGSVQDTDSYSNYQKNIRKKKARAQKLDGSPEALYKEAYSLLQQKNYAKAQKLLLKLTNNYAVPNLLGSSFYWLGETYYVQGEYPQAAVQYLKGYQADMKGSKAPENLLKLAHSLFELDRRKEACTTINKLKNEFPELDNFMQRHVEQAETEIGCF